MATTLVKKRKRGADPKKLTVCEQKFVMELLAAGDWNLAAAVRKAYPNCRNPAQYGTKLMQRKRIKDILGKIMREDVEKLELDRHEVLRQLWYCLSRKATDFIQEDGSVRLVHEMSDRAQSVIDGFEVEEKIDPETGEVTSRKTKIKVSSKLGAIEQAAKHLGLFAPDKIDVSMAALEEVFANLQRAPSLGPAEERLALEEHRLESEEGDEG